MCKACRVVVTVYCVAVLVLTYPLVAWIPVIGKLIWLVYAVHICCNVIFA